jgi:hypothetical protein
VTSPLPCPGAVDEDAGAVDKPGGGRGEEEDVGGDLADAPDRTARDHVVDGLPPLKSLLAGAPPPMLLE